MPRSKSALWPTSWKLLDVPGVPPPAATVTSPSTVIGNASARSARTNASVRLRLITLPPFLFESRGQPRLARWARTSYGGPTRVDSRGLALRDGKCRRERCDWAKAVGERDDLADDEQHGRLEPRGRSRDLGELRDYGPLLGRGAARNRRCRRRGVQAVRDQFGRDLPERTQRHEEHERSGSARERRVVGTLTFMRTVRGDERDLGGEPAMRDRYSGC